MVATGFLRRVARREEGVAMVEFALIMVVFFTLLFGIMQGGLVFGSWIVVTNAAREGARFGSVCITRAELPASLPANRFCPEGGWSKTNPATNDASIVAHTRGLIAWPDPSGAAPYNMAITSGHDAASSGANPRLVTVRITYRMPVIVPLLEEIIPGGALPLVAESEMRIEE